MYFGTQSHGGLSVSACPVSLAIPVSQPASSPIHSIIHVCTGDAVMFVKWTAIACNQKLARVSEFWWNAVEVCFTNVPRLQVPIWAAQ